MKWATMAPLPILAGLFRAGNSQIRLAKTKPNPALRHKGKKEGSFFFLSPVRRQNEYLCKEPPGLCQVFQGRDLDKRCGGSQEKS